MKKNMGSTDRLIRTLVALILVVLYLMEIITGTLALILMIVAVVFVLTSLISFCPLYTLLGVNTCNRRK
jgi:hypothetical protein